MVRFGTPEPGAERSQQRQSWLAMRAAYQAYRQASALAHRLADELSNDPASSDRAIQLQTATLDQRTAFESYIEARLQFLESSCDPSHHTGDLAGPRTKRFICAAGAVTLALSALNILGFS